MCCPLEAADATPPDCFNILSPVDSLPFCQLIATPILHLIGLFTEKQEKWPLFRQIGSAWMVRLVLAVSGFTLCEAEWI